MTTDDEIEQFQRELELLSSKRRRRSKQTDPLPAASEAELAQMMKELDGVGEKRPVPQNVQDAVKAAKTYVLKRDRSQLISLLERAGALAATMDDPTVTSSLQDILARVRDRDVTGGLP